MKIYLAIILLMLCKNCFTQKRDVTGTYFMTFGQKGYMGCCRETEVLRFNADQTFSIYTHNDQGDYQSEGMSYGKFRIIGDSIFFLSDTPYLYGMIKDLPFNDSIDKNFVRLTFAQHDETVEGFINNTYYAIDDSFNISKLKVAKTFPDINMLFDTIFHEYKYNYQKNSPIKKIEVYLEKPNIKTSDVLIIGNNPNPNISIISLNIPKAFLRTNDLYIDKGKGGSPYYFDYSGYHFKVHKDNLKPLLPVDNGAGVQSDKVLYEKLKADNFDSLIISVSKFDSVLNDEKLVIKKDKSIKFNYSSYFYKTKLYNKTERSFFLTDEMYNVFLEHFCESAYYEIGENNEYHGDLRTYCNIDLYLGKMHFKNYGNFLSKTLYHFLFKELITE